MLLWRRMQKKGACSLPARRNFRVIPATPVTRAEGIKQPPPAQARLPKRDTKQAGGILAPCPPPSKWYIPSLYLNQGDCSYGCMYVCMYIGALTSTATIFGNSASGFVRVAPVVRPPRNSDMPSTLNDPTCTANAWKIACARAATYVRPKNHKID